MLERLADIERRYEELSDLINDPEIIADNERWRKLMKEHSDITPIVEKYREYKKIKEELAEAEEMLNDSSIDDDFKALVKEEFSENKKKIVDTEEELKILMLPKDPNDDKNVIVEIRGGAGGVHRVQRIPATESSGRIHTSTASVAVLPEVEAVDVKLNMNDCRFDVFRASGNGGQCVNTTDSAVRLTHYPTGIVISCQDEKSQLKNKEKALKVLMSRLYDLEQQKQHDEIASERKSQIGRGNRNERIRTYNYPQGRVTDHRIGLTLHRLDSIIDGDLDEIMDALITTEQAEKLKAGDEAM